MPTNRYQCPECGYVYDEAVGDRHEGFVAGTTWDRIPDDFCCPDCAVRYKSDFVPVAPRGDQDRPNGGN